MHRVSRRALGLLVALSWPLGVALAEPPLVPWSAILPGLTTTYESSSANVCQSGQLACVDAVIAEMRTRFDALDAKCDHATLFALTYLRTTEQYKAAVVEPGFFSDPAFINHQDANFAKQYFDAWDAYHGGNRAAAPRAWQIALRASESKQVNGTGSILLGMSAHVNRDLPFVLEAIGLVKPDGTSRKPDHDKVNVFLSRVVQPLFDEAAARYDPIVDDTQLDGTQLDEAALVQLLVLWRELAWRNAEALVSAPTPQARALVAQQIENAAAVEANLILVATSYAPISVQQALGELAGLPVDPVRLARALTDRAANTLNGVLNTLLTPGAALRDRYCASHG